MGWCFESRADCREHCSLSVHKGKICIKDSSVYKALEAQVCSYDGVSEG